MVRITQMRSQTVFVEKGFLALTIQAIYYCSSSIARDCNINNARVTPPVLFGATAGTAPHAPYTCYSTGETYEIKCHIPRSLFNMFNVRLILDVRTC